MGMNKKIEKLEEVISELVAMQRIFIMQLSQIQAQVDLLWKMVPVAVPDFMRNQEIRKKIFAEIAQRTEGLIKASGLELSNDELEVIKSGIERGMKDFDEFAKMFPDLFKEEKITKA
jgi:hypothetical protein